MFSIREIASRLCEGIKTDDQCLVEGIIDDQLAVIKLICCARCSRLEGFEYHWTPIHCAARWGKKDFLENLFRSGGIPVNLNDERRRTPLWYAAQQGHEDTCKLIMKFGARKNMADRNGWMALHAAARSGRTEICKLLVESGARIDARDKEGWTALHKAAWGGYVTTMKVLLELGSTVDAASLQLKTTSLHLSVANDDVASIKCLLAFRADIEFKNKEGMTALYLASYYGATRAVNTLLDFGASFDEQAHRTGRHHHYQLGSWPDIYSEKTADSWTALHAAVQSGHLATAKMLVTRGADVNISNSDGWRPIHTAAYYGHGHTVRWLSENGADIWASTNKRSTALHLAAQNGHTPVVKVLIDGGLDVNIQANDGRTPLHLACLNGHIEVVKILIEAGAEVNLRENTGWSALHIASTKGHMKIVQYMVGHGANLLHSVNLWHRLKSWLNPQLPVPALQEDGTNKNSSNNGTGGNQSAPSGRKYIRKNVSFDRLDSKIKL